MLSEGECVLLDADPALGDMSVDTDGDSIPDLVELGKEITMEIPKYYGAYYESDETVTVTCFEFRSNPVVADTDGDGFPDNNDLNPTEYDVAVEQVVGATGGAGTVIRLNTGAIWRISGLSDLNEYYEQYYTRIFNISPGGKEYLESIKELLDANKESNFTIKELATFQQIDLPGVVDYMDGRNFTFKKQLLSEVRGEQCTDEAARSAYSIVSAASAWTDYFRVTWNQIVRGKYAEETNLLGTIGEIGMAFVGFDFFQDFRDLAHDGIFWEDTPEHKFETVIDGIGVVPVVGILSKGDEILALIKHSDLVFELRTLGKLDNLLNVEGVYYLNKLTLTMGSAGCMLQDLKTGRYWEILQASDSYRFYKLQYNNPIATGFKNNLETVNYIETKAPGMFEEIIEEAAQQTGKSADEIEEFVEEALKDAKKVIDAGGGKYSGKLIKVNSPDVAADALAVRIGGESRVKFANDPSGREFDVVSDEYIAQAKPDLSTYGKSWRNQTKATFEAAKETGRKVYFQFEGQPNEAVLRKIEEYANRYGVEYVIDTTPLGVNN